MKQAFGPNADFTGMGLPVGGLWISEAVHKAVLEVNEEGTEAAAATAQISSWHMDIRPALFRADHPFLFLIRDNLTGSLLFMGRMSDPTAK